VVSANGKLLATFDDESKRRIDELLVRLKPRTRTDCVRDMFVEVLPHQERNDKPTVPSEAAIRLQTRIACEEFVEKIEALYDDPLMIPMFKSMLEFIGNNSPIRKDLHDRLPEFADALADNAVTNEGFGVLFGIDVQKVFDEVHAANMRKKDGPIVEGKRGKPEGWVGPDVVGVLRNQGWTPSDESKVDVPIPYRISEGAECSGTCSIHGDFRFVPMPIEVDGRTGIALSCPRCESARYNGSDVDPIGESVQEPNVKEEPQVLMLGVATIREKKGDPVYSMIFSTNDTAIVERCRQYMQNRTKVIPEPVGMYAYPISIIKNVHVRPAAPSDAVMDRRYSVEIEFWKIGF
jgi:predicted HAD superfamily Cof-like phosphohydrolase